MAPSLSISVCLFHFAVCLLLVLARAGVSVSSTGELAWDKVQRVTGLKKWLQHRGTRPSHSHAWGGVADRWRWAALGRKAEEACSRHGRGAGCSVRGRGIHTSRASTGAGLISAMPRCDTLQHLPRVGNTPNEDAANESENRDDDNDPFTGNKSRRTAREQSAWDNSESVTTSDERSPCAATATPTPRADSECRPHEAMLLACITGDAELVAILLDSAEAAGMTTSLERELITCKDAVNDCGDSALTVATLCGHEAIVRLLLAADADVDYAKPGRCRALMVALLMNSEKQHTPSDIDTKLAGLRTPARMRQQALMCAGVGNNQDFRQVTVEPELVQALLDERASPDPLVCDGGWSPLEIAVTFCSSLLVRLLFEAGATLPRAASHRRDRALKSSGATKEGSGGVADYEQPYPELLTPLELSRIKPDCLRLLLAAKASPHGVPHDRPIVLASIGYDNGDPRVLLGTTSPEGIKVLLEAGAK